MTFSAGFGGSIYNADEPQANVVISKGVTGELEFYANFLYSGREDVEHGLLTIIFI